MRVISLLGTIALASGCATLLTGDPLPVPGAADSTEYAGALAGGPLELRGQAFLTTRGGEVKLAAGRRVTLDPWTSYSREWFRRFGAEPGRFEAPAPDSLFLAARQLTVADAEGRFRFSRLHAGTYLVRSLVTWQTRADSLPQGGVVAALARVREGESNELVLSELYTQDAAGRLGVEIVSAEQLGGRRYRVVARVSGTSCQTGADSGAPTETEARVELVAAAAREGGDAVTNVTCRRRGASLSPGCVSRVVCEGDAIAWS